MMHIVDLLVATAGLLVHNEVEMYAYTNMQTNSPSQSCQLRQTGNLQKPCMVIITWFCKLERSKLVSRLFAAVLGVQLHTVLSVSGSACRRCDDWHACKQSM